MVTRPQLLLTAAILLCVVGLALAKDFYTFPSVTDLQPRDIYLLRRPAVEGYDNYTGTRNITGASFKAAVTPQACVEYFDGSNGVDGAPGPQGPAGSNGAPGSQIFTDLGAPGSGTGVNGDWYMDTSNGDYYLKAAGAWTIKGNLTGPTGPAGPSATVDQPAVLSALQTPGGEPTTRQPLAPQTDGTALWQLRDLVGNVRAFFTGAGSLSHKDASGVVRWQYNAADYSTRTYRGDGTTVAMMLYSSGRVEHFGPVVIR